MTSSPSVERHQKWIETGAAIVLSAAGLLTSWSSYQAALWDGEQAAHYSRANAIRVRASKAALEADAREAVEVNLFNAWLTAEARGEKRLADFYRVRFPPELHGAFEVWLALRPLQNPKAPLSPFANDGVAPPGRTLAKALDAQADATFEAGQRANEISDSFVQGTVYFAMALFFAGMCQVFRLRAVRLLLLAIGAGACGMAISKIVILPTLHLG